MQHMESKNSEIGLLGAIYEAAGTRKTELSVQRTIQKIVAAYSSITDEDVAGFEELGIFNLAGRSNKSLMSGNYDAVALGYLDDMEAVKPLSSIFRRGEFISVEDLESQLDAYAGRRSEDALSELADAAEALPGLLKHMRKSYARLVAKSEAGPEDPLGRIAFAMALTRKRRKGAPYEPDTSLEKKLGKAIEAHFEGHMILSPEMAQLLRDLMSQGLYPNMLAEPTAGIVYRGMNIEDRGVAWLKKQARGELIGKKGMIDVNMKYKPKRGAASWTTKKKVAEEFFNTGAEYHIILHARVEDNPGMFLSAEKGLYKTDFAERFVHEHEALGLGTIKVFRIEWKVNESGGAW